MNRGVISAILAQIIRAVASLVLARALGPEAFAAFSVGNVVLAIGMICVDLGMQVGSISFPKLSSSHRSVIGVYALAGWMLVVLVVVGLGQSHSQIQHDLQLILILTLLAKALALPYFISALHSGARHLVSTAELIAAVSLCVAVSATVSQSNSYLYASYFLVPEVVIFLGLFLAQHSRSYFAKPDRSHWRQVPQQSYKVATTDLLNRLMSNLDNIFVLGQLGATKLSFYSLGYRVMALPSQVLGWTLLRNDAFYLKENLGGGEEMAYVSMRLRQLSLMAAVFGAATALVPLAVVRGFGESWTPAIETIQIFCVTAPVSLASLPFVALVQATGNNALYLRWTIGSGLLALCLFPISAHWGIEGVALAVLATQVYRVCIGFSTCSKLFGLARKRLLAILAVGPFLGLATYVLCVSLLRHVF